jgi:hypothetical protein
MRESVYALYAHAFIHSPFEWKSNPRRAPSLKMPIASFFGQEQLAFYCCPALKNYNFWLKSFQFALI